MLTRKYEKYEDYVEFQLRKTRDKEKQKKWLGVEWEKKIRIFKNVLGSVVKDGTYENGICLGSRTGQEVVALKELGVKEVIGIDLEEFPPYTIKGDIHDIKYENETFDIVYTNILDHTIKPTKLAEEIYRILKENGIFILHYQYDCHQDIYTELVIKDIEYIYKLFNKFSIESTRDIDTGIIAMNKEIIFKKNNKWK